MYLLFQHHTTLEILRNVSTDTDIFTITGTGWHFIKYLGPAVVVVGPDTRSERNPHQVMSGPTYQGIFPKVATLPPSVQHCIWMVAVPIIYPRLDQAEQIANTVATGKKAVTGTYNLLGKVTSSVAGVVGARSVVASGFDHAKRAVGKSGLMGGILNPFGDIDIFDELRDQWTHESKVSPQARKQPLKLSTFVDSSLNQGPRTHIPHPHPPRNRPPENHPHDLPLRRCRLLWRRAGTRPGKDLGPQDHVPDHLRLRRQHPTTILRPQAPTQQQTTLRTSQRTSQHTHPIRHQRRHDGNLHCRTRRPPPRSPQTHGPQELRRHRRLRPGNRPGHLRPHRHERRRRQVEPRRRFHGPDRRPARWREQVWSCHCAQFGLWSVRGREGWRER